MHLLIVAFLILCGLIFFCERSSHGPVTLARGGGLEVEARWLNVPVDEMRRKILENGGSLVHDNLRYRRYVFRIEHAKGYARCREEYDKDGKPVVTITCKIYEPGVKYADEYEITTSNTLDDCKNIIERGMGLKIKAYHETFREKYAMDGCHEVVLDTLPGLNTYIEVDCGSEDELKKAAGKLGLAMDDAQYGAFFEVYASEYGVDKDDFNERLPRLDFEDTVAQLEKYVKHDLEKLKDIVKGQASLRWDSKNIS